MSEGIKETKEMAEFLASILQGGVDSIADNGTFDIWDFRHFFKSSLKVIPAFKGSSKIWKELSNLDDKDIEELQEMLNEIVASLLDILKLDAFRDLKKP